MIQKSSNVGTTKLAMQMPAKEMWETFSAAGFGQKPQIGFPGAISGRLRPYKTWRPVEQATMSHTATACRPACSRWPARTPCLPTAAASSLPRCSRPMSPLWASPFF